MRDHLTTLRLVLGFDESNETAAASSAGLIGAFGCGKEPQLPPTGIAVGLTGRVYVIKFVIEPSMRLLR